MNTKQSHINLSNPVDAPVVLGINAPLSSLSELDAAAQHVLKDVRRNNSAHVASTLEHVFLHPGGITTAKLRQLTGLERTILSPILTRLIRRGYIDRVAYGVYRRSDSSLPSIRLQAQPLVSRTKSRGSIELEELRPLYADSSMSILEYLSDADRPCTIPEIVEATGLTRHTVSGFLARECGSGLFDRVGHGQYQWNPQSSQSSQTSSQSHEEASESPRPKKLPQFKLEFGL